MKMQGFVILEISKTIVFVNGKKIKNPQRNSDAGLHFQAGIKRNTEGNSSEVTNESKKD